MTNVKPAKIHPAVALTCAFALCFVSHRQTAAEVPAFPGAEGFGAAATGGRKGAVYEVVNLNDGGPGSLRAAVEAKGPRTVVFRVSGNILLESALKIKNGDLTIAGQTAPGDGICLANHPQAISADNVVVRYLRVRPGDVSGRDCDSITGSGAKNVILDHCSASWSIDECLSFYNSENVTIQWCLISESLCNSHHAKGAHGYGGIWGGDKASFHHNLLAHHSSRNPRFAGQNDYVDHRNNVIYNWGFNSAYGGETSKVNMIANYYKPGPATKEKAKHRIVQPYGPGDGGGAWVSRWYVAGNFLEGYPDVTADNWNDGVQGNAPLSEIRADRPFPAAPVTTQTAEEACRLVLADVGATRPSRDPLDARIIHEVRTGTATYGGKYGAAGGIIDSQTAVGGWPELKSTPPPTDRDHDGMPDAWETRFGFDPEDSRDGNRDADNDGYTNLEEYLNASDAAD